MSTTLEDIWDAPVSLTRAVTPHSDIVGPHKRPRETLFLSDSEDEQPALKRPASSTRRSDVDALFADIDKDDEDEDDLTYKPLAPALDLQALHKQAAAKHVLTPHQILPSSSPPRDVGLGRDNEGKGKGKDDNEGKKAKKKIATLDEAGLVGAAGFPQLITNIKDFKIKGKGHEHSDLHRILQVYQFWSHRLFPKTPFKDTIERIEKLCHSKRMQVRLSVWRDEAKGLVNGKKPEEIDDDDDVIDLTDPNIDRPASPSNKTSSHAASLPPSSSGVEDDDFDIDSDTVIQEEEKRLAALRAECSISSAPPASKARYKNNDTPLYPAPPPEKSSELSILDVDQDEEMWDMVRELEREEQTASKKHPVTSVLSTASAESASMSLGTNDEDFDDMYL